MLDPSFKVDFPTGRQFETGEGQVGTAETGGSHHHMLAKLEEKGDQKV
jgi:hypothetical protein